MNQQHKRVGIRKAFHEAHLIRQIAASNPMDRVAILRFLLALLYWCKGNPPERVPDDTFPHDWFNKLDDKKDRFNLLGEGKRFYQDCSAERPQAITQLIQEIPAGNNFWHFRHSTDKKNGLCPACCAIGLLRLPLFAVSGLSGPGEPNLMAGINGVPPVYVVSWRESLLETLSANWTTCTNIGDPSWVEPSVSQNSNKDVPLLTDLTQPARRVLLHEPIEIPSTCINCGKERTAIILTCEFQTAGKQENDKWNDPHVIYLGGKTRKTLRTADLTTAGKFRMDRPWADLLAQIAEKGTPMPLIGVGFSTNKAKNIDVWERIFAMPQSQGNAKSLLLWRKEGTRLGKRVAKSKVVGPAAIAPIRPHVEHRISEKTSELVAGTDENWAKAGREYESLMEAVAKSFSPGYTTAVVQKRRHIASLMPDMHFKRVVKKHGQDNGGVE